MTKEKESDLCKASIIDKGRRNLYELALENITYWFVAVIVSESSLPVTTAATTTVLEFLVLGVMRIPLYVSSQYR